MRLLFFKMVNTFCGVSGCHKEFYPGCGISFHRLPSNAEIRRKWLELIPGKLTDNSVICRMHFKSEDYLTEARKKLKPGVIPSVFPKIFPERKRIHVLSVIQVASSGAENVKPGSSQGPPSKKIKIQVDTSTQTPPSSVSPREAELKREVKIMKQRIKRRNTKINNLKSLLNICKQKCNNFTL